MLPLRYPQRWQLASVVILAVVLGAAFVPVFWGEEAQAIPALDKWLHAVTFCGLAIWFCGQYARSRYAGIAMALLVYGALIEIGQAMVPYRTAEWGDLVADGCGIALGVLIAVVGMGGWSERAERWLGGRID